MKNTFFKLSFGTHKVDLQYGSIMQCCGSEFEHFSISDPGSASGSEHFFYPGSRTLPKNRKEKEKLHFFMLLMVSGACFNNQKDNHPGSGSRG
jgi:hypothetical protein